MLDKEIIIQDIELKQFTIWHIHSDTFFNKRCQGVLKLVLWTEIFVINAKYRQIQCIQAIKLNKIISILSSKLVKTPITKVPKEVEKLAFYRVLLHFTLKEAICKMISSQEQEHYLVPWVWPVGQRITAWRQILMPQQQHQCRRWKSSVLKGLDRDRGQPKGILRQLTPRELQAKS